MLRVAHWLFANHSEVSVVSSGAVVRAYVESLVKQLTDVEQVVTDGDGDFPVRVDKTLFYVSIVDNDDPVVQIFSFAVQAVPSSDELLAKVNEINGQLRFCRMFYDNGRVVIATDCVGLTLDEAEFRTAIQAVAGATEHFAPAIATEFGGHLAIEDEIDAEAGHDDDGHIGQYL